MYTTSFTFRQAVCYKLQLLLCLFFVSATAIGQVLPEPQSLGEHHIISCRIEKPSGKPSGILLTEKNSNRAKAVVSLLVKGQSLSLQVNDKQQDMPSVELSEADFPVTIELEKEKGVLTARYAPSGKPMQVFRQVRRSGLRYAQLAGGQLDNIRLTRPAASDAADRVDRKKVISRLEVLDVNTGERELVYEAQRHFEAPNWLAADSQAFIINSEGLLYRLSAESKQLEQITTDFTDQINNDHGISPDGTRLVISHSSEDFTDYSSVISTLPIEGGKLTQITNGSPSYWHGWSPDGQTLAYTAEREENFDIYTIPADGSTTENRLTIAKGLDDGPEYSPDGQYIYFNSERSGSMEIWRMKHDGNEQTQITHDRYNNWFPHLSPDGKWMIFISYEPEVAPGNHPPNKKVMLRMLPVGGEGEPKVLAYLYGGQGTINVPSWSPDSRKVAFVSYSYTD